MKKKNIIGKIILINFFLTIIFMFLQNALFLVTFGIAILCTLGIDEINSDTNYIYKMKESYSNFKVSNIQNKLLKNKKVFSKIIFITSGVSLILGYIYYLLIKYNLLSIEITLGLIIPLNILIFPMMISFYYLIIVYIKKTNIIKYNTKVLAECIKVDESIQYMDHDNGFHSKFVKYIVIYKYNYNNKEYIVSAIEPQQYEYVPTQGSGYYIYIDKDNPENFIDNLNDYKKDFLCGIIFLIISLIIIFALLYAWLNGNI